LRRHVLVKLGQPTSAGKNKFTAVRA
jgi:hypothetical protein